MSRILYKETRSQIVLDKFSCLPSKERSLYLPSGVTRPIKHLPSPSALVVLLQLILEKEKPQSFIPQVGVFLFLLPLLLCPAPPSHTPFGGDNPVIIPSSPCLQTPLTHSTLLCCPPSFPITPPHLLSYYVLYYFDPSPSICFNWIMICNHVLSGESIK